MQNIHRINPYLCNTNSSIQSSIRTLFTEYYNKYDAFLYFYLEIIHVSPTNLQIFFSHAINEETDNAIPAHSPIIRSSEINQLSLTSVPRSPHLYKRQSFSLDHSIYPGFI